MKNIMIFFIVTILFISLFVNVSKTTGLEKAQSEKNLQNSTSAFTHTVFIEEGMYTWCSQCENADEALYSLYNSSEYPFYFVELALDKNLIAKNRFIGHYRARNDPVIFIDGGFRQMYGTGSTPQETQELYRPLVEEAGIKAIHPIELMSSVIGHGDATLDITVTVKNNGSKLYLGYVRSYVTEIVSRWTHSNGDPYHFGFLDYAIEKPVILGPQKLQTFTMTWDGKIKHGNLTFPDIVDTNIMVITTVVHWQPHLILGVKYIRTHLAFYVDQTIAAIVE